MADAPAPARPRGPARRASRAAGEATRIEDNIFLMTRVREETLKSGTHRGMLTGLAAPPGGGATAKRPGQLSRAQ
ncbi:MAG TPA: hypothetical protein VMV92_01600 [Streptosporangiaceae bacterium]|nr:hypothetical protein [Streptosporangiaceae bacterium]